MTISPLEEWIKQKTGTGTSTLSREQLRQYQLARLQETISRARTKSPFYRRHLSDAPPKLSCLEDLTRFPFTTHEAIRNNPLQFLCVSQADVERVVTLQSSGTTGKPKRLYFTAQDIELTLDFFHIGMSTFTKPGDRVLILLPGERPDSVGDLLARALDRLGATRIKHGPVTDPCSALELIMRQKVTGIVGIPTQILWLAKTCAGKSCPPLEIKNVLLTTDYVPRSLARFIEQTWDCKVYNHYGMTEMGLGGGVDCHARQGYHLREADLYFEIINPETGESVKEGEEGEVVFTTLTRTGMPLIRYRTGDISRFLPHPCPCGTKLRTMEHVQGRIQGGVDLGSMQKLTMAQLDEVLFSIKGIINYQAAVVQEANRKRLNLSIYTGNAGSPSLEHEIKTAVSSFPAVQKVASSGTLILGGIHFSENNWFTDGVSKRMIFDARI